MPKIEFIEKSTFKKTSTEADFRRSSGTFYDVVKIVTAEEEATRTINVGHRYLIGRNQLEVYVDGQFKRKVEELDGVVYGDYEEISSYEIRFEPSIIFNGDQIRFRITWGTYNPMVRPPSDLQSNLYQLAYDMFGNHYEFDGYSEREDRVLGIIDSTNTPFVEIDNYRTWKITENVEINNLLLGKKDDIRYIIFDSEATINSNISIRLEGDNPFTGNVGDTIVFIFDGYSWRELSRSLNSL